jgi:MSHA pilin protein MshA
MKATMTCTESKVAAPHHGFTLIELVITIVLIGILAAVAIPNFADLSDDAKKSKASAIFGSLKASYAVQSSVKKGGAVTVSEIVTGHDPSCSSSTALTTTCGNAAIILAGAVNAVTAPSGWTCHVSDAAGTPLCP